MDGAPPSAVVDGVQLFGPYGNALPQLNGNGNGNSHLRTTVPPPRLIEPGMIAPIPAGPPVPAARVPFAPLQPHPVFPPGYPPIVEEKSVVTDPMSKNEFATNAQWGVVDWAQRADMAAMVDWDNITNRPSFLGSKWFNGDGPPPYPLIGSNIGDYYLNNLNGDIYELIRTA